MARPVFTQRVEGLKELQDALLRLPKQTGKRVVRKILKKALEPVARTARSIVSKQSTDSGNLAKSIDISTRLARNQRRSGAVHAGDLSAYVGSTPERHAHLVEFGTGPRVQRTTGRSTGSMPAAPFMRPAWKQNKSKVLQQFGDMLGTEIERAAARLAKRQAKGTSR